MLIHINGIDAGYIREGSGAPILILPGWGATSAVYHLIVKQLAEAYSVYVLDLPGFGITPEPERAWSIDDYADFVVAFIEKAGLDNIVLFGHSYGGRIIINLCNRKLPFTIKEIVLIDSAGIKAPLTQEQKKRQEHFKKLKRFYQNKLVAAVLPGALDKLQRKYGSSDYASSSPVMRQTLVKAVTEDYSPIIPHINNKTLLIWGKNDTATPLSDANKMHEMIRDSKLEVIADAGHFPFIDQPFEFRKILSKYFGVC